MPVVAHLGRRRDTQLAALRQHVDALGRHRSAERESRRREAGEQLAERPRVDDRAGQAVVAERLGLLEHADLERRPAVLVAHEPRQLDRAGEARGARADEQDVERRGLVPGGSSRINRSSGSSA